MKRALLRLLIFGGLVAFAVVVAAALFLAAPYVVEHMRAPRGPVLVYEIDPGSVPDVNRVDMAQMVAGIDARLNSGGRFARVRSLDNSRIEIALYYSSEPAALAMVDTVDRRLQREGKLEFRILANQRDNKDLIARAMKEPSKTQVLDEKGKLAAWWVPVVGKEVRTLSGYTDIATRTKKGTTPPTTEVLVLPDSFNVTDKLLKRATPDTDQGGHPCIRFEFTKAGGKLFGSLTGSHLPDIATDFSYKLGIILDGTLYTAPAIRATISDRGEITGSFTREDVEDIAGLLNSGSLPAKVRRVKN